MNDCPKSLLEFCLDAICDNLLEVFDVYYTTNGREFNVTDSFDEDEQNVRKKFRFKDPDMFLFGEMSEKLLVKLAEKDLIGDSTLNLFSGKNTRLQNVKLKNVKLTHEGLKVLRDHKIVSLECVGVKGIWVNKILECLSDWSISNLISLNVSGCTFIDATRYCLMVALTRLKSLRNLNVAYTEFNQTTLESVCEDLKHLEKLDVSGTSLQDLSPLNGKQLTTLTLSDLKMAKNVVPVIITLSTLRHLDVSLVHEELESPCNIVNDLFHHPEALQNLISLDISGWRETINRAHLETFLTAHPKLRFLGLVLTSVAFEPAFSDPNYYGYNSELVVAGLANESQIKVTLAKYPQRSTYVQKTLYHLFQLTSTFQQARPDIFELMLPSIAAHPTNFGVQMAATACLYNLTRGELSKRIHPRLLSRGVNLTLIAMEHFPDDYQLQKNSLLTLCSDRILQDVTFERFRCAKLVLDSLCTFDNINMNRMAVAICSILAAKISTEETSELGARPVYMHKLLTMVQNRVERELADITLKFTLSALWNLTDESAATCTVFLEQGGAMLFLNVLKTFRNDEAIETKVLGLLNNIAEVEQLRHSLMLTPLVEELFSLVQCEFIDVSYFAAGIIAHLASDGLENWTVKTFPRNVMLDELYKAVYFWKVPDSEMVAYRSFKPFFPLLRREMEHQIQLWAVWAIHHVCSKNPKRYCLMLQTENGVELLRDLSESKTTHEKVRQIVEMTLDILTNKIC